MNILQLYTNHSETDFCNFFGCFTDIKMIKKTLEQMKKEKVYKDYVLNEFNSITIEECEINPLYNSSKCWIEMNMMNVNNYELHIKESEQHSVFINKTEVCKDDDEKYLDYFFEGRKICDDIDKTKELFFRRKKIIISFAEILLEMVAYSQYHLDIVLLGKNKMKFISDKQKF